VYVESVAVREVDSSPMEDGDNCTMHIMDRRGGEGRARHCGPECHLHPVDGFERILHRCHDLRGAWQCLLLLMFERTACGITM